MEAYNEEQDPNNKTCITPVFNKVQPVMERVKPVVQNAATNISNFFEDDESEVITEVNDKGEVQEKTMFRVTPTCFGAAVVGMIVGSISAGPVIGLIAAGGAGYAR